MHSEFVNILIKFSCINKEFTIRIKDNFIYKAKSKISTCNWQQSVNNTERSTGMIKVVFMNYHLHLLQSIIYNK